MTAQVAILNKEGVALATDSAATVDGSRGVKIYNTINKLFTLSKLYPVGIMVYSSSQVMGLPVETLIKVFRAKVIGDAERATIAAYSGEFLEFLEKDDKVFTQEARDSQCVNVVWNKIACVQRMMQLRMMNAISRLKKPTGPGLVKLFDSLRNELLLELEGAHSAMPEVAGLTKASRTALEKLIEKYCLASFLRSLMVVDFSKLSVTEQTRIKALLFAFLFKDVDRAIGDTPFTGGETGFVLAGYGRDEYFPHLRTFEFVWSNHKVTCIRHGASTDIEPGGPWADVRSFAQHEMVDSFTEGRVPELDEVIAKSITAYFGGETAKARKSSKRKTTKEALIKELEGTRDALVSWVGSDIAKWTAEKHKDPMLETVEVLPKEELAVIAEALVDLTITKRHASPDAETVGPPTDVAIISKGDGFIWIKRKHYFKPELNPHFVQKYFKEVVTP